MFGNDRNQIRQVFFTAWNKRLQGDNLSALENIIVTVIDEHPEYHKLLQDADSALDRDWTPEQGETNPFLHMGMHISIQEQLGADLPAGIKLIYQQLLQKYGKAHEVEHQMIDCLGLVLWQAQTSGRQPDLQDYQQCLQKLL
ncbi:MAG: DUF1841 family protein [Chromatiales bacterium]|jgi:hypothetical protein